MSPSEPLRDRPQMPKVYGIEPAEAGGMIEWSAVADRLAAARNYWVATTRADGRPHVTPVWGVWLDGAVMFDTDVNTVKALNLALWDEQRGKLISFGQYRRLTGTAANKATA